MTRKVRRLPDAEFVEPKLDYNFGGDDMQSGDCAAAGPCIVDSPCSNIDFTSLMIGAYNNYGS